jgi:hypothetical protein
LCPGPMARSCRWSAVVPSARRPGLVQGSRSILAPFPNASAATRAGVQAWRTVSHRMMPGTHPRNARVARSHNATRPLSPSSRLARPCSSPVVQGACGVPISTVWGFCRAAPGSRSVMFVPKPGSPGRSPARTLVDPNIIIRDWQIWRRPQRARRPNRERTGPSGIAPSARASRSALRVNRES